MSDVTNELRAALRAWLDAPGDDLTAEAALVVAATTWFEVPAAVAVPLDDIDVLRRALDKAGDWIIAQPTPAVFQREKDEVLAAIDAALRDAKP